MGSRCWVSMVTVFVLFAMTVRMAAATVVVAVIAAVIAIVVTAIIGVAFITHVVAQRAAGTAARC